MCDSIKFFMEKTEIENQIGEAFSAVDKFKCVQINSVIYIYIGHKNCI